VRIEKKKWGSDEKKKGKTCRRDLEDGPREKENWSIVLCIGRRAKKRVWGEQVGRPGENSGEGIITKELSVRATKRRKRAGRTRNRKIFS